MSASATIEKIPRSVELTEENKAVIETAYSAVEKGLKSVTDVAIQLGILPATLERMRTTGSCAGKTYIKLFGELPAAVSSS
ncbi:MAG: hypothetical protein EOP50_00200 [Sphingobacteriales bacterium]|nr:MAG: hypothetical protein EOP50_00200 [Sphingobacteriales bacterium]